MFSSSSWLGQRGKHLPCKCDEDDEACGEGVAVLPFGALQFRYSLQPKWCFGFVAGGHRHREGLRRSDGGDSGGSSALPCHDALESAVVLQKQPPCDPPQNSYNIEFSPNLVSLWVPRPRPPVARLGQPPVGPRTHLAHVFGRTCACWWRTFPSASPTTACRPPCWSSALPCMPLTCAWVVR